MSSNIADTKSSSSKLLYITFLQSFATLLVIIGHCLPLVNGGGYRPLWATVIFKTVMSFHMALFFVLGGFLLMYSFSRLSQSVASFKNFIMLKMKRLLIPYVAIGTLAYLLKIFIFNKFAYRPAEASVSFYLKSLIIPWDNPNIYLWFLPTMLIVLILGYFILKRKLTLLHLFIFLGISILSAYTNIRILNITGVMYYLFFFFLGAYIFMYKDKFFSILKNKFIFAIVLLLFPILLYYSSLNPVIKISVALAGIYLSFAFATFCTNHNLRFLKGILDGKYYQIYILSWFFQTGFRVFYQMNLVNYETVCILMFVASIVFPLLITFIIQRYIPKLKIFIGL